MCAKIVVLRSIGFFIFFPSIENLAGFSSLCFGYQRAESVLILPTKVDEIKHYKYKLKHFTYDLPVYIKRLSLSMHIHVIGALWPLKVFRHVVPSAVHILAVLSTEPKINVLGITLIRYTKKRLDID